MKTQARRSSIGLCALLLILLNGGAAKAQDIYARISVASLTPGRVKVEGRVASGTTVWSFRNQYGAIGGLADRVENLVLHDESDAQVALRKIAPGEYSAEKPATRFAYEVRLEPPAQTSEAAHVSWLTSERGLLLPADLLPKLTRQQQTEAVKAELHFILPPAWNVAANETLKADKHFVGVNTERSVFLIGSEIRQKRERVGKMEFSYVTSGKWAFTDEELSGMATSILKEHAKELGGTPRQIALLILIPFPSSVSAERWSAETRGGTVVLLTGQQPSRTAALAQLSFPLTHELFHLWVPNALSLDGEYAWFYEGFTLYQALRAGMRLQLLSFQDYLNALGRAFDAYLRISGRDQLSLIEASQQRWQSMNGLVYHKGLLIAYLYDLTLRQQTKSRRSLDDVYRELFRRHHSSTIRTDGNTAIINLLKTEKGLQELVQQYIEKASPIDLRSIIAPFGLEMARGGVRTHLSVVDSLSSAQQDLLREFGYNEKAQRRR